VPIAAIAAIAAAAPATAQATRVALYGPSTRYGFRAEIEITGTRAPNRIGIDFLPDQSAFVVTDPSGLTVSNCFAAGRTRAGCVAPRTRESSSTPVRATIR